jgi:phosphoglycerate dehydrogenase-like enzyme
MSDSEVKHHVVQLDGHVSLLPLRFPHTFEKYLHTSPSELPSRIASATIAIATTTTFTRENFSSASSLQLVSCLGAGCDKFDLHAAKEYGVTVTNTPAQNTSTVAEHAISLYFAVKRRIVELNEVTKQAEMWKGQGMCMSVFKGVMPRVCEEEVVGVIGYGALGKCSHNLSLGSSCRNISRDSSVPGKEAGRNENLR